MTAPVKSLKPTLLTLKQCLLSAYSCMSLGPELLTKSQHLDPITSRFVIAVNIDLRVQSDLKS